MHATVTEPTGAVLLDDVLVVRIRDGRLGFSTTSGSAERLPADGRVTLTGGELRVPGAATVVRSGTAFEEVRGRTRLAEAWHARWRRRRDDVVVLVTPDESP